MNRKCRGVAHGAGSVLHMLHIVQVDEYPPVDGQKPFVLCEDGCGFAKWHAATEHIASLNLQIVGIRGDIADVRI